MFAGRLLKRSNSAMRATCYYSANTTPLFVMAWLPIEGREVKHTGDGIMAAFTSVVSAVTFAVSVQQRLRQRNQSADTPFHISIGITRANRSPTTTTTCSGAAVQLAARLCAAASDGDIAVSVAVRELCIGKSFRFADRGEHRLKGLPEPTPDLRGRLGRLK